MPQISEFIFYLFFSFVTVRRTRLSPCKNTEKNQTFLFRLREVARKIFCHQSLKAQEIGVAERWKFAILTGHHFATNRRTGTQINILFLSLIDYTIIHIL